MFLSTLYSLIRNVFLLMALAFRRQKFIEFAEFNGWRLIGTRLFKLGPTINFKVEGLRTIHTGLILWRPHDCFMDLPARVRRFLRKP